VAEDVKVERKKEHATYTNFNPGPVTVVLPGNKRVTLRGRGEGTITGPRNVLDKYVPVITMTAGPEGPVRSKSSSSNPEDRVLTDAQKEAFQRLQGEQNVNEDGAGLSPFSEDLPPVVLGVDYNAPLTLDMIHADGFNWRKVKNARLKEFAEENMIDIEKANGNRMKITKIIKETLGEV